VWRWSGFLFWFSAATAVMYNGIGLTTVRGSGTNGYVQRNLGFVRKTKEKVDYKTEEQIAKAEAYVKREPNAGILDHERKRKLEVRERESARPPNGCLESHT